MSSSVATRIRLAILVTLAAPQFLIGLWAVAAPRHWFDRFPGIDPRLVAAEPPFNEHLATDAGAGFLATDLALAVAAVWGHRIAIQTALLAFVTFAAPHLLYHAANPSAELTSSEDLLNVVLLATGPVLAALLAWRVGRARPVAPATPRQQGKEDEVPNDEAQIAGCVGSVR